MSNLNDIELGIASGDISAHQAFTKLKYKIQAHEATIAELRELGAKYLNDAMQSDLKIAELQEENKNLEDDFGKALFFLPSSLRAEFFKTEDWKSLITPPDSKPKLLDHNTSEDCWCEPEEVSDGVFVHKDRH